MRVLGLRRLAPLALAAVMLGASAAPAAAAGPVFRFTRTMTWQARGGPATPVLLRAPEVAIITVSFDYTVSAGKATTGPVTIKVVPLLKPWGWNLTTSSESTWGPTPWPWSPSARQVTSWADVNIASSGCSFLLRTRLYVVISAAGKVTTNTASITEFHSPNLSRCYITLSGG
jgi:hypothetical protein